MLEPLTLPSLRTLHASGFFQKGEQVTLNDWKVTPFSDEETDTFDLIVYSSRQFRGLKHTPYGFAVLVP